MCGSCCRSHLPCPFTHGSSAAIRMCVHAALGNQIPNQNEMRERPKMLGVSFYVVLPPSSRCYFHHQNQHHLDQEGKGGTNDTKGHVHSAERESGGHYQYPI